jgi:hypothetical protein
MPSGLCDKTPLWIWKKSLKIAILVAGEVVLSSQTQHGICLHLRCLHVEWLSDYPQDPTAMDRDHRAHLDIVNYTWNYHTGIVLSRFLGFIPFIFIPSV